MYIPWPEATNKQGWPYTHLGRFGIDHSSLFLVDLVGNQVLDNVRSLIKVSLQVPEPDLSELAVGLLWRVV